MVPSCFSRKVCVILLQKRWQLSCPLFLVLTYTYFTVCDEPSLARVVWVPFSLVVAAWSFGQTTREIGVNEFSFVIANVI